MQENNGSDYGLLSVPARNIKVLDEVDVVVVGAGVSGFCSAIASARAGARTLLIERNSFPGGVSTSGLMCSITNLFVTRNGEQVIHGLPEEFVNKLVLECGAMPDWARPQQPQIPNDPVKVKQVMISMLKDAGVKCIYGAMTTQVIMDGNKISAVIAEGKGGAFAIRSKQFVDATGDLDLYTFAGTSCKEIGGFSTYLFRMANVDIDSIVDWFEKNPASYSATADIPTSLKDTIDNWRVNGVFHIPHYAGKEISFIKDAIEAGEFSENFGKYTQHLWALGMFSCKINNGVVLINSCAFLGNDMDIEFKSECEEEGRLVAKVLSEFLIKHFPGFQQAYVIETANEIGMRWSRRLNGKKLLDVKEFRSGIVFEDAVGCAVEVDKTINPPDKYDKPAYIPFGCLVADVPANLINASGKSAATEPAGLLRGQAVCMVIGEAAGTASALACKQNVPVNQVDIKSLQKQLISQGVFLGEIEKNL